MNPLSVILGAVAAAAVGGAIYNGVTATDRSLFRRDVERELYRLWTIVKRDHFPAGSQYGEVGPYGLIRRLENLRGIYFISNEDRQSLEAILAESAHIR